MKSLNQRFSDLSVKRFREQHKPDSTYPAATLQSNISQRKFLRETFDYDRAVKVGDIIDPFTLTDARGNALTRDMLTANGPAVLIFFRYGECPADNIAMPYYEETLWPFLEADGVSLVGISPQRPERGLWDMKKRHTIGYPLACDMENQLANRLGITFVPRGNPNKFHPISDITGIASGELPITTTLVIDSQHVVRFAEISVDWLNRAESPEILKAVADVLAQPAQQTGPEGRHL